MDAPIEGFVDTVGSLVHMTWMDLEGHCCPPSVGIGTKVVLVLRVGERVPLCPLAFELNVD